MTNRLQEIKDRHSKATSGPWARTGTKKHIIDSKPEEEYGVASNIGEVWNGIDANAEFIAHAREDIPWLLDEIATLKDKLAAAEQKYDELNQFDQTQSAKLLKKLGEVERERGRLKCCGNCAKYENNCDLVIPSWNKGCDDWCGERQGQG